MFKYIHTYIHTYIQSYPVLDEGGEVQHVDFIERVVTYHDEPVIARHGSEGGPDPVVLSSAVLRENVRVELALT